MRGRRGFTLVEILIVVVILGILAAIVTPIYAGVVDDSRRAAFVSSLMTFAKAVEHYSAKEGAYPVDGSSGVCPPGFEAYIEPSEFESPTPIGGVWDTETNDNGFTCGVGVHFNNGDTPSDAFMTAVDASFDDGVLTTGVFQRATDPTRFYYVVAP